MPSLRDIRRCALQALYQFDSDRDADPEIVRGSLEGSPGGDEARDEGFELAVAVWAIRDRADAAIEEVAENWPVRRQPVVDRNILRLAFYELTSQAAPPKVVINEAVELAREFSTEKSPAFVNGILDQIYHRADDPGTPAPADETPSPTGGE